MSDTAKSETVKSETTESETTKTTATAPTTPREVFERLVQLSAIGDWGALADLYADDVIIEIPFAMPGAPRRAQGNSVFRGRLQASADRRDVDQVQNVVIHETADPEVVIGEYELHLTSATTGEPHVCGYVTVIRVRDGKIVHSRGYSDPLAQAEALGKMPDVLKILNDKFGS